MNVDIGIPSDDRARVAESLYTLLADTFGLYLTTHAFHWNVTGPNFGELHALFESQYNEQWKALDEIAERIRALGHYAPGTLTELSGLTTIPEPNGELKAAEMLRTLVNGHAALLRTARLAADQAEVARDQATLDLVNRRLTVHEKDAWMLRSLLEA